jgi:hypothetical protein
VFGLWNALEGTDGTLYADGIEDADLARMLIASHGRGA